MYWAGLTESLVVSLELKYRPTPVVTA